MNGTGNRMLDVLPPRDFAAVQRHLEPTPLPLRQGIHRVGEEIVHIYFPVSGVISVVAALQDGSAVEVGTVGKEGLVGLSVFLGQGVSPHEVLVQGAGSGYRGDAVALQREFERLGGFREIVLRFTELFLAQVSQTAACNGRHGMEARCARWLLTMYDQLESRSFPMTQEFLAMLLGVQRTGVTATARELQRDGLIQYAHGQLTILDPAGLEIVACECRRIIRDQRERFLRNAGFSGRSE